MGHSNNDLQHKKPWIPRGAYSKLSKPDKVSLWAITISCFVTVFTFWLGLSYQYIIVANKKEESQKSIHFNIVRENQQNIQAYEKSMLDIASRQITAEVSELIKSEYLNEYLESEMFINWNTIIDNITKGVAISEKAKYYLSEEKYRLISFNNAKICIFLLHAYEAKKQTKKGESIISYFLMINNSDSIFYNELYDSLTYVSNQYEEEYNLLNKDKRKKIDFNDYPYGCWIVSETLFNNKSVLNDSLRTKILKSRYSIFKIICTYLTDNYRAIKSELEPINKNETNSLSNVFSEPGVYISIMSLIIVIPIGFIIWWFFIWLIFRHSEAPSDRAVEIEKHKKQLEYDLSMLSTISKLYTNQQLIIRELEKKVDLQYFQNFNIHHNPDKTEGDDINLDEHE